MPPVIGFSGTRRGMTAAQLEALRGWLNANLVPGTAAHHGACLGADEHFVDLVWGRHQVGRIEAHPSNLRGMTSSRALSKSHVAHEPLQPLTRNRAIVAACEVLLACPDGPEERLRSGTWATVRAARKAGRKVVLFFPDGSTREE